MSSSFFVNTGGSAAERESISNDLTASANAKADAQKLAINAEDAQYTLSDGTTTGNSALHHAAKAEASATSATGSASTATQQAGIATQAKTDAQAATADALTYRDAAIAASNNSVLLTGAQTVAGAKTFSNALVVNDTVTANGLTLGDSKYIKIGAGNGSGIPDLQIFSGGGNAFIEQPSGSGNNTNLIIRGQTINLRNDADATLISTDNDQVRMWTQVAGSEDSTNGAAKFSTTTTGVNVKGTVTSDGLRLGNNESLQTLRTDGSTALTIYTDATHNHTYIDEAGGGNLVIDADSFVVRDKDGGGQNRRIVATQGSSGSVALYYGSIGNNDSDAKLNTTATGISVKGTVTADKLVVSDNSADGTQLQITNGSGNLEIIQATDSTGTVIKETGAGDLIFKANDFYLQDQSETGNRLTFNESGLKLYDGDALEVLATVTGGINVTGTVTASGNLLVGPSGGGGNAVISGSSSPSYTNQAGTNLLLKSGDGSGTGSGFISFSTSPAGSSGTTVNTSIERMRLDPSGNVLVGKAADDFGTVGTAISQVGEVQVTRASATPVYIRRNTNIGELVGFYKDNSAVGSITTDGSATAYNTSSD